MTTNIEQIIDTYTYHDPSRLTIPIGTAAINLQLAAAGLEPPYPALDIDTITPPEVWQKLMQDNLDLHNVKEVRVRRWSPHNGSVVDLIPDPDLHPTHLPFSACTYLYDYGQLDYASLQASNDVVVVYGIPCLALTSALEIKAMLGRPKDKTYVEGVLPVIIQSCLLSLEQTRRIEAAYLRPFGSSAPSLSTTQV